MLSVPLYQCGYTHALLCGCFFCLEIHPWARCIRRRWRLSLFSWRGAHCIFKLPTVHSAVAEYMGVWGLLEEYPQWMFCTRVLADMDTHFSRLCLGMELLGDKSRYTEKAMAAHSSTLAWKIPWTEDPGRLQSMGSLRVGHDWATSLSLFTFMHGRRKWQPTPVFLPGESQGRGSLVGCHLWDCTESDMTEAT